MRKSFVSICFVLLISSTASAFAPIAIPAWYFTASLVLHGSAIAAGLYYAMKSGSTSNVDSSATVSRPSSATWIDLTATVPTVKSTDITAKLSKSQAENIVSKSPSGTYPKVESALKVADEVLDNVKSSSTVGQKVNIIKDGVTTRVQVTTAPWKTGDAACIPSNYHYPYDNMSWNLPNQYQFGVSKSGQSCPAGQSFQEVWTVNVGVAPPPAYRQATPEEFARNLTGTQPGPSGAPLLTGYQAEIDKMLQDPNYVPVFSDDTTGLPFAAPVNVATPAQVAAYNANGIASDSASNAAAAASSAATTAGNNYVASGGNLSTGVGGDPALYQKYKDALAAAAAAQSAADKLAAEQATKVQDDQKEDPYTPTATDSNAYGDASKLGDFGARFTAFTTKIKSSAVWSYMSNPFGSVPTSSTSTISVSMGRYGSFNFDFASFASIFSLLKSVLLIITSFSCFKIVTLKGGA